MTPITVEMLRGFLEDTLGEIDTARVEQELRASHVLREHLRLLLLDLDRGDHSFGAIWRRHRCSCPTREQLGSYLLDVLEPDAREYMTFHLNVIGCPSCQANLADLKNQDRDVSATRRVHKRIFDSSADLLR